LVAYFLIVLVEEISESEHYVDFVSSGFDGQTDFCNLDLNEALGAREAASDSGDVDIGTVEHSAYDRNEVGINTDGCHIWKVGMFVGESVDPLCEIGYRTL
jgi:hypothetical protein